MSNNLEKDLDLYLQNMKKKSKKPGWIGLTVMILLVLLLIVGFISLKGIIGTIMLLVAFFIILMIIGSFMIK